jgi:Family of unknown function (DUF6788)
MSDQIKKLKQKKAGLHKKLEQLGTFRRGTISINYRKCGKKNCACAKPGHKGHGPQYLWSTTVKGKSYAKNLKIGPELQKYITETENYRIFVDLCDKIIKVNQELCELQGISEIEDKSQAALLKKKLEKYFSKKHKGR